MMIKMVVVVVVVSEGRALTDAKDVLITITK